MVATDFTPLIHLQLSLQLALLGEVTPNLYAVTAGFRDDQVIIVGYYNEPPSEDDVEHLQYVSTEVASDLPWDFPIVDEYAYCLKEHKPEMLDFWAFLRAPGLASYL